LAADKAFDSTLNSKNEQPVDKKSLEIVESEELDQVDNIKGTDKVAAEANDEECSKFEEKIVSLNR